VDETSRREPVIEPPLGPPHLADPRALQILSTEHWSLLTARSLAYNEFFARGSMFLTLLSASLVALGFIYQGSGGGPDFPLMVIAVLAVDLFVGLATLGRLAGASSEEMHSLQAMARIRHAYLEMVPTLQPYISASHYDDLGSVLAVYGALPERPRALLSAMHGVTTMPGMISVLNAGIAGGLVGAITFVLVGDARLALVLGLVALVATMAALTVVGIRTFYAQSRFLEARFPHPGQAG